MLSWGSASQVKGVFVASRAVANDVRALNLSGVNHHGHWNGIRLEVRQGRQRRGTEGTRNRCPQVLIDVVVGIAAGIKLGVGAFGHGNRACFW